MKKQVIRLTESDLHKIIKNTVSKVIKEARIKRNPKYTGDDEWRNYYDHDFDDDGFQDMRHVPDEDLLDIIGMETGNHIGDDGKDYSNAFAWKDYDNFIESARREYNRRHKR